MSGRSVARKLTDSRRRFRFAHWKINLNRAFCSQVESLGVAEMRLKQTDRAVLRFRETVNRSKA